MYNQQKQTSQAKRLFWEWFSDTYIVPKSQTERRCSGILSALEMTSDSCGALELPGERNVTTAILLGVTSTIKERIKNGFLHPSRVLPYLGDFEQQKQVGVQTDRSIEKRCRHESQKETGS